MKQVPPIIPKPTARLFDPIVTRKSNVLDSSHENEVYPVEFAHRT